MTDTVGDRVYQSLIGRQSPAGTLGHMSAKDNVYRMHPPHRWSRLKRTRAPATRSAHAAHDGQRWEGWDGVRNDQALSRWVAGAQQGEEFTHTRLLEQAEQAAAALTRLGVRSGDQVAVMLPLTPESVVVTLACGRIDAARVSLPLWDAPNALRRRVRESGARVVVTADSCHRADRPHALKSVLDRALVGCHEVRHVLVAHRSGRPVGWIPGRDQWWHEALRTER